jgi:FtsP/CotA-like multicopper oxidase with cupredoxin domain
MIAGTQAQMSYQTLNVLGRDGVPVNWNASTRRLDPAKPEMVQRPNVFLPPGGRVDLFVPANTRATLIGSAAASPFCTGPLSFTGLPSRGILRIVPGARLPSGPGVPTPRLPRADRSVWTHAALIARRPEPTVAQRALTFTEYDDGSFYVTQTGTRPKPLASYVEHPFALRAAVAPPAPSPLPSGSRYQADIWVHKLAPPNRTVEVWNLYNATAETHAFHIHQLTFVALQSAYEPTDAQQVFLDTIAVPPATVFRPRAGVANQLLAPSLTQIKIDFTDVAVGTFVFHCHMLFHEDAGMMGIIHVY